jgi:hypothetical protein
MTFNKAKKKLKRIFFYRIKRNQSIMIYDTDSDKYSWYMNDNNFYGHMTKLVNSTDYDAIVHYIQFVILLQSWLNWSSVAIIEPNNTSENVRAWGKLINGFNALNETLMETMEKKIVLELNIPLTKEQNRQCNQLDLEFNKIGEKYGYPSWMLLLMYLNSEPLKNYINVISRYNFSVKKIIYDIGEVTIEYKQNILQKRN